MVQNKDYQRHTFTLHSLTQLSCKNAPSVLAMPVIP